MYHISWKGIIYGAYKDVYAPRRDLKNYGKDAFVCDDRGNPV
jgi:hypothetical protein